MPTQDSEKEIKAKIAFNGDVLITYINKDITFEELTEEVKEMCKFDDLVAFTIKWVDEEGDPCLLSTQLELDEAVRLYNINRDAELSIHGEFFMFFWTCQPVTYVQICKLVHILC